MKSAEAQTSKDAKKREEAENRYESALADINGLTEKNAQLKAQVDAAEAREEEAWRMQSKAEQRAKTAEEALKKQPIAAVVDKEEVARQAREIAAEMTADLRAQLEQASSGSEQDARNAYDSILRTDRSIENIWQTVKPLFRKMPEEQREDAANHLVHTLAKIQGEVSKCL